MGFLSGLDAGASRREQRRLERCAAPMSRGGPTSCCLCDEIHLDLIVQLDIAQSLGVLRKEGRSGIIFDPLIPGLDGAHPGLYSAFAVCQWRPVAVL